MTPDPQTEIARLQYAMREQATEINRLRDEIDRLVDWIMGDRDALTTLPLGSAWEDCGGYRWPWEASRPLRSLAIYADPLSGSLGFVVIRASNRDGCNLSRIGLELGDGGKQQLARGLMKRFRNR